jgi:polyvinyl alcohol dehydrogenase (cytochrome)
MSLRKSMTALAAMFGLGLAASPALAQAPVDHPGRAVYGKSCASCHDNPGTTRAATLASMQTQTPARLREVLTEGVMAPMAAGLSQKEMADLIAFLTFGQQTAPAQWTDAIACTADRRTVDTSKPVVTAGFGIDGRSTRSLNAKQAGIKKGQMKDLEIAWALAFPGQGGGTGPAILGDTMFINGGGRLLALDTATGCAKWTYASNSRNTPAIGDIGGRKVLALSIGRDIHVVDAASGQLIWKASGQPQNGTGGTIRGGVVFAKDKVIVPISASGVASGTNARFECCTGHGSLVALNVADGKWAWEYHTMPEATHNGQVSSVGVKQRGPSGAPIWSVPTIDEKRNRVIVTTGENTSHPGTDTSDAVIAIDLATGQVAWRHQAMAADVWNMACDVGTGNNGPNCPVLFGGDGRDFDFGAAAVIAKGKGGTDVVLAGQKSGHVWALDAETGKVLWSQRIGEGTALGGVHWGIATDGANVFAPINDPIIGPDANWKSHAGLYAFDIKSGKPKWSYAAKPDCAGERGKLVSNCETKYGFSAAPIVIDGAVVGGTLGGELFVFDGKNGKMLKKIDLIGPKTTINPATAGKGGSIDAHGVSAGAGMIFVNSGYGSFGQTPGNVLIALKPVKK